MSDRLISADALIEKSHWWCGEDFDDDFEYVLVADINAAPTIEAVPLEDYRSMEQTVYKLTKALAESEPRKHGRWIKIFETEDDLTARCSECGIVYTLGKGREPNYCGTCGAKMDEESDIDENWYSDEYRTVGENEMDEVEDG